MKDAKSESRDKYEELFSKPLWYEELSEEIETYILGEKPEDEKKENFTKRRGELIKSIAQLFIEKKIYLAEDGSDFDEDRKNIDMLIIHHSAETSEMTWQEINVMHMLRIYVPEFLNDKRPYSGTPIWSNHFTNSYMIFCGYHYLIWPDGSTKKMLKDGEIGWHAGDWDINCRSIGVCFMGDLSDSSPTTEALRAFNEISSNYRETEILGHNEVLNDTICPGEKFLGGWKTLLQN